MKKNISINLFGTLYNIDEDAYNLLENYLQSMQRYFARQEGGAEIADDIEHRVAELLWKKREAGMTAVDIDVVKGIIDTIGKAEDIAGDGGNKSENAFASYDRSGRSTGQDSRFEEDFKQFARDAERFTRNTYDRGREHVRTHRFYRCANDKVLGGVCSGLATYFEAGEPVIWRLGAVALTLIGIGLPLPIIYIVMWLVTPAALTPEDRLRQKGMDVTPDNLAQQVKYDSEPVIVKDENKGCLKGCLVAMILCILLPMIFFFTIWGKMIWGIISDF
ncbi:MAG: PspC domain-containing protein [Bacteroidaceae bacterium]|nr:PspC domain-containing protein [Bacteroidaceae bacterium]